MTLTGSGVGGNVGGPQVPLQRDLETTAWSETTKAHLNITTDSLEKALTQISPRYTSGSYYGGYKSPEGQPLLDHPLESGRIARGLEALPDEEWRIAYHNLLRQLPDNLQQQLAEEGQKPIDERKGSIVALDNLLTFVARITTRTSALAQANALTPMEQERARLNQVLPFTALRGSIAQGTQVVESALAFVQSQGPNHPLYDTFSHTLTEIGNDLKSLQWLAGELQTKGIPPSLVAGMTHLANHLEAMNAIVQRTHLGSDLHILKTTMQTMTTSAHSLALYSTGAASLFLGLSLSSIGMKTSESESGIVGDSFARVIESLSTGLVSSLIPNATVASRRLLEMSLTAGFASLIGLSSLAIEPGFGTYPNKDVTYAKSSRFFAFELALLLMNSSGALKQVVTPFLQASGADDKSAATAAEILSQVGNLLMIFSSTRDGKQNPAHLVESTNTYIEKGVLVSGNTVNSGPEESSGETNDLSIALQQAQIALDEKNYEGFLEIVANLLESMGTTSDQLTKDIDLIGKQARTFFQNTSNNDTETTTVVNFV